MKSSSRSVRLMGTTIETRIWHENASDLLDQVESLLYLYQQRFSANDLTSELMEVNLNAGVQAVPVASDLYDLIQLGKGHSCAKDSHLNIAIGPLVQAWRIGFQDAQVPTDAAIQEALRISNPEAIQMDDQERLVYLEKEGMRLDLGALAKGYVADQMVVFLQQAGVEAGLVNLGGTVRTFGRSPHASDGRWRIGIQDPAHHRGQACGILAMEEAAVVTSGIYERTLTVNGETYHHILDRLTGYPIQSELASLTIVAPTALAGEIWTTRLFGYSAKEAYQRVEEEEGIEAILITREGKMLITPALKKELNLAHLGREERLLPAQEKKVDSYSAATEGGFGGTVWRDSHSGASVQ